MEMNHDEKALHQIEQELDIEIFPGTEIMADIGAHHFVKSRGQRVLVPQPSANEHDPLNWSTAWKASAIVSSLFVSFMQGFGNLSLAPMFGDYMQAFNCSLAEAVQFTGVAILVLGFSNFVWVPISTTFGRRPVWIFSQLLCLGASIWRARATTYGSFMGACVLNGFAAGPAEAILPTVIADIYFLHDRGKWNTLYWVVYMGATMISPTISGPMAAHVGWRNFWWFTTAAVALSLIMVITMFPETKWHRSHPTELNGTHPFSEKSKVILTSDSDDGKATVSSIKKDESIETESAKPSQDQWVGRGRPCRSQWGLYQPNPTPLRSILLEVWIPVRILAYPIVEFASFVVSWSCSSFLNVTLTQTQAFAAPPYNWSTQSIGFTNFAIFVGALIGLATAGPLSDWVSARATRRNRGIREPEMRLPAMIPYVIIMYIGNIVVSIGYERKWPWQAIVLIGYTCAGIQVAAIPGVVSTYAVDSYKPVAGSLFIAITINKNVWGYGFSRFITNWIIKDGYIPPIMTNASLIVFWCLFGILFYYKGKTFRRWSKDSSVHRM